MSENQPSFFYGVAYGYNRGVFPTYKEAMAAMKGFPQAVYKKFKNREDAEEFVQKSIPEATLFEAKETDTDDKFYAVARGRVIGIFKDLETVKKNTHGFPKSMHKKFTTFAEAKSYFDKFSEGKVDETAKSPRRKRTHPETNEDGNTDGPTTKTVARKRTSGKVGDTDESEGGELDHTQTMNESAEDDEGGDADQEEEEKETDEGASNKKLENTGKIEDGGDCEEKKDGMGEKNEIMDEGKEQKEEADPATTIEEPQQKGRMEE
ncbi:hypothetical protein ACQ4LE_008287 [Meloidogyne hapla]